LLSPLNYGAAMFKAKVYEEVLENIGDAIKLHVEEN
jgi:predicted RNase H-like HicB family nuclease